jgi:hypothetical protein
VSDVAFARSVKCVRRRTPQVCGAQARTPQGASVTFSCAALGTLLQQSSPWKRPLLRLLVEPLLLLLLLVHLLLLR